MGFSLWCYHHVVSQLLVSVTRRFPGVVVKDVEYADLENAIDVSCEHQKLAKLDMQKQKVPFFLK